MTVARNAAEMVAEARATIEQLTVEELELELAGPNVVVVDLRELDELIATGSIPSAVHVPRGTLEFQADAMSPDHNPALRPDRRVILHCATGGRSALGAATLARMGYRDVAHLDGGITAWIESGRPTRRDEDMRRQHATLAERWPNP
jgi:rhodanese-related sulfurtransferase